MPDRRPTPLQSWWRAESDLLADARSELDEREWAVFVALLTIRVASENARFLDLEEGAE
jgi:hypothetical protein